MEGRTSPRSPASDEVGGRLADVQLRALQLVELDILREFVRLCEAHGLRYYLAYGTLLGAVRHRGFIPWDDDVDVTMPRDDYDRFADLCVSELPPGFAWQTYRTNRDHPYSFGKLLKTDTVLRQAPSRHLPIQHSVHIDVFPLDGVADTRIAAFVQRTILMVCRSRLGSRMRRTPASRLRAQLRSLVWAIRGMMRPQPAETSSTLTTNAIGCALAMLFEDLMAPLARIVPRRMAISALEAMNRRYPPVGSTRWFCLGGRYGYRRQSFPGSWFGAGTPVVFEDLTVVGPAHSHAYLTQLYGDYAVPPPRRRQVSHHGCTELDLGSGDDTGI
jgi:lipopolysaccharide cholinephosphotransferase